MSKYLGIDTSNYTTSVALYDSEADSFVNEKKLLPVKSGEKGLRQSDAVFHHTVQLPELFDRIDFKSFGSLEAVGVSVLPTTREDSYMPCFLSGISAATAVANTAGVPLYRFSHQQGHIAAVLASTGNTGLLKNEFLAFHLSGGTTDALLVKPDKEEIIDISLVAHSLDLKAGQAVDRAGLMLGLDFPCGAELDRLAVKSDREFVIKPSMKGADCSLSGIENKCKKMLEDGELKEDIAKLCISYIALSIDAMISELKKQYGSLPIVFCGGVSSNTMLQKHFKEKCNAVFSTPEYSTDNAAGIAYLAYLKNKKD